MMNPTVEKANQKPVSERCSPRTLLAGVRVADFSRTVAAGFCAKLLAELGARVTRCETGSADSGPLRPAESWLAELPQGERAALEAYLHGDKEAGGFDPFVSGNRRRAEDLIAECGLVVEDLLPSEREATGWERILQNIERSREQSSEPAPIDVSVTDFGQAGARANTWATELTRYALSGQLALNGEAKGQPYYFPGNQAAYVGGLYACVGALLALVDRGSADGAGGEEPITRVEHATVDGLSTLHQLAIELWCNAGIETTRQGNRHHLAHPNTILPCKSGWVVAAMIGSTPPELLAALTQDPGFASDPRFSTAEGRMTHPDAFDRRLGAWLAGQTKDDAVRAAQTLQLPFGRVRGLSEVLADPHYVAREFWITRASDEPGPVSGIALPGVPFRLTDAPAVPERAPMLLPRNKNAQPLAGLRVLELTAVWVGPMVGRILAEQGAEVTLVEWNRSPLAISIPKRKTGLPGAGLGTERLQHLHTDTHHRGKRSLALNLATETGRALLRELARNCDVLVENFRPGVLEGWGCGYDTLASENPGLVALSLSGFGRGAPLEQWRTLGPTLEGETGWASLMGAREGAPLKHAEALTDPIGALNGLVALLAAIHRQRRTGRGCHIDLSQAECGLRQIGEKIGLYALDSTPPARRGNRHPAMAPHGVFRCRGDDAWIALSVCGSAEWAGLCRAAGWREWLADSALEALAGRKAREEEIERRLARWCAERDRETALDTLNAHGVSAAPMLSIRELCEHESLGQRAALVTVKSSDRPPLTHLRTPIALSGRSPLYRQAPRYGADTRRVLREWLDLDENQITDLAGAGVVALSES